MNGSGKNVFCFDRYEVPEETAYHLASRVEPTGDLSRIKLNVPRTFSYLVSSDKVKLLRLQETIVTAATPFLVCAVFEKEFFPRWSVVREDLEVGTFAYVQNLETGMFLYDHAVWMKRMSA